VYYSFYSIIPIDSNNLIEAKYLSKSRSGQAVMFYAEFLPYVGGYCNVVTGGGSYWSTQRCQPIKVGISCFLGNVTHEGLGSGE